MILIDEVIDWGQPLNRKYGPSAHMFSDLLGEAGTQELLAFARKIGMRAEWIQSQGTRHEHFDVFGNRRPRAIAAGARDVTKHEAVAVWKAKQVVAKVSR